MVLQIYQTEVSIWQAVTWDFGVRLSWDIFRISDFFWKLGGGIKISVGLYSAHYGINNMAKTSLHEMLY